MQARKQKIHQAVDEREAQRSSIVKFTKQDSDKVYEKCIVFKVYL